MVDILKPQVSCVVKGIKGKIIEIYGTNSTGKTANAVKAKKPMVLAFEPGLNAISGVNNHPINDWLSFRQFVKQLISPARQKDIKENIETIIIDSVEPMGWLCADFVCEAEGWKGIEDPAFGKGYKKFSNELQRWIYKLANAGITVIFIAHEGSRPFLNEKNETYDKIYPKGDKRLIDPINDLCDIIGFAQVQPFNERGEEVLSTLYLKGTPAYHARTRFKYMPTLIKEWSLAKLETELAKSIEQEEKETGVKSLSFEESEKIRIEAEKQAEEKKVPVEELIQKVGEKVQKLFEQYGQQEGFKLYQDVLDEELGTVNFQVKTATEKQRQQVEAVLMGMEERGY